MDLSTPASTRRTPILTQADLERHLWQAADILRGTVDSGDYKQYIFGLLFYRRLCDVCDEEFEALLAETGDRDEAADPDEHRFHIPPQHHWNAVRKHDPDRPASEQGLLRNRRREPPSAGRVWIGRFR
jgi:type I restriction enzyme M protein